MSLIEIKVQPRGDEARTEGALLLDGQRYLFSFFTNTIDDSWNFDVSNEDGTAAVKGIALANGIDLLHMYRHLDMPPGPLWIQDKGLLGRDPGVEAFASGTASLLYLEVLS